MQTNRIRELRTARGWSLEELAEPVGTSGQQIGRLERGERRLTLQWMNRIANAFGVTPAELLDGGEHYAPAGPVASTAAMPEALPYQDEDNDPRTRAAVTALTGDKQNIAPWTLHTRAIEQLGYMPGDVVFVDLNDQHPASGAVVCAQLYDWQAKAAETVFRLVDPPYLVAAAVTPMFWKPQLIDNERVVIKGRVIASMRLS